MDKDTHQVTNQWTVGSAAVNDKDFALGIMRLSLRGEITFINRAAKKMVGETFQEGMLASQLALDDQSRTRLAEQMSHRFEEHRGASYRLRFQRPDDQTWVQVLNSAVPEYDAAGQCIGSIGFFIDESIDVAATEIHKIIGSETNTYALFKALCDRLREVISFDSLMVSGINMERELIGEIFEFPAPPPKPTPTTWWSMRPFVKDMFVRQEDGPLDLVKMFERPEFIQYAKEDPAVEQFMQRGFRHALRFAVKQDNRLVAMLSLLRKSDVEFTPEDFKRYSRLPLVEAVNAALRFEVSRNIEFGARFVQSIAPIRDAESIGQLLVNQLAHQYGWDHVSLFRLSPASQRLELICQAGSGQSRFPDGYSQATSVGLLGRALSGKPVVVGDVTAPEWQNQYHRMLPDTISEMVLPIPSTDNHWLLNVESSKRNAFADEEPRTVAVQLNIAGFTLERMASLDVQSAIVRSVADAVFITNEENVILNANPAALELLGRELPELKNRSLAFFIASDSIPAHGGQAAAAETDNPWSMSVTTAPDNSRAAEALANLQPQQHLSVKLAAADGELIPATLSVALLPKRLGGKVFVVSDSREQIRFQRTEILNKVYYQLASELRVPLALSETYLADAQRRARGATRDMIDKARRQISKADLPLERIVRLAVQHQEGTLPRSSFDLREAIDKLLAEFPEDEAEQIRVLETSAANTGMPIEAPRKELLFCVRSLVAYLLTRKAQSEKVDIELQRAEDDAAISIALPALEDEDVDLELMEADCEFKLIEPVIEDLMARMSGSFQRADHERLGFKLQFKAGS